MALGSGTRLGPYEIVSPLGAGGMGEVYRARDTRLGRDVAIKILPDHLSSLEARQRFEREAQTISRLSHPHICALYDVGHQDGVEYLVMEYLEGQTLADRLAKGPLALEQVIRYGIEIADALDRAHCAGIVHRDLKPGNVMLTKSGVKLLDFGLAKLLKPANPLESVTSMPTQGPDITREGSILGTIAYMAPEQLEGKEADARTDVFAFGAVLYEMATGRKAFTGASQASLISSILTADPPSISSTQSLAPPALDRLVRVSLAKDPEDRWQSARDVALHLEGIRDRVGAAEELRTASPARKRGALFAALAVILIVGALAWALGRSSRPGPAPSHPRTLSVLPPEKTTLAPQEPPALSPNGDRLAFIAVDSSGKSLLYVRPLDSPAATPLADTENASMAFWSPDGRSLGFFANGKLKTIDTAGGRSQTLADAPVARGGSWSREGAILFVPSPPQGPYLVAAAGGEPKPVPADSPETARFRRSPYFLPDGRHYLFLDFNRDDPEQNRISVGSIDSKESKPLVKSRSTAVYGPSGYLLYRRESALMAQRFDAKKLELSGEPFRVVSDVGFNPVTMHTLVSVANDGMLAYTGGGSAQTRLVWFGRDGKTIGPAGPAGYYNSLSLAPDEKRVALEAASANGDVNVWMMDLENQSLSRFTFGAKMEFFPLWSPDGARIVFGSLRGAPPNLYQKPTSGAGAEELLLASPRPKFPVSWSRDGRYLLFQSLDPKTKWDLWVLPMFGDRKPIPFAQSEADELTGDISPDGRWVAYASNESGNFEVYVRPFPSGSGQWQLSRDGGFEPLWRRDGKELYYVSPDRRIMAVEVNAGPSSIEVGNATALFTASLSGIETQNAWHRYAVTADGTRFLVNTIGGDGRGLAVTIALEWDKRRASSSQLP